MRVAIDTQEMKKVLGRLSALLDGKSDLESFRTVRLDVVNGKLRFSSATPTIYASDIYEKDEKRRSQIEPFGVDGREFYDTIRILGATEGECTLVIDKTTISIEKGRTKIKLKKYAEDVLLPIKSQWPEDAPFKELDVAKFIKGVKKILFVPENDFEKDIHAATIHINKEHVVTTNRKVLVVEKNHILDCPDVPFHMAGVSAEKFIKALSLLEGTCLYLIKNNFFYLSCGAFRARLTGVVMAYPSYRSVVMGHTSNFSFGVDKDELITALRTAGIAAYKAQGTKAVTLSFEKDGLHVDCDTGHSSSNAVVKLVTNTTVPSKVIFEKMATTNPFRFDLDLLLRGINSFSSDLVVISIDSTERPMLFSEDDYDFYIALLRN